MINKKTHLTHEERFCIEKMLIAGNSVMSIAKALNRGVSTINQEVNNNGRRDLYNANEAQTKADNKQINKKNGSSAIKNGSNLQQFIFKNIDKGLSPEVISKIMKNDYNYKYVSGKTIRKFLKKHS